MKALVAAAALWLALPAFSADVPRPAAEFTAMLPGGKPLPLSQYRGKVVLMQFLYTTCPHCQHASSLIEKLQAEFGPKGLVSIGVAFNPMSNMLVEDYTRDLKLTFPIAYQSREAVHQFLQHNPDHLLSVPQIVFIDRKGDVRYQSQPVNDGVAASEENLRKWIHQLINEAPPASAKRKRS